MKEFRNRSIEPVRLFAIMSMLQLLHACGGGGDGDQTPPPPPPPPPADTTAPTVSISSMPAVVSRTVEVGASASDSVGVTQVEFRVDGTSIGTDSSAPYAVNWDTGATADGTHTLTAVAQDAAGNTATSTALDVEVRNQLQFTVQLSGAEENPSVDSAGSGTGSFQVNLSTGAVSGTVTTSGFTPTAAHIHDGFAGVNGSVVVGLEQDSTNTAEWRVPASTTLTSAVIDRLLAGALYVNAHSSEFPAGEVRAQILPQNIRVFFSDLSTREEPGFVTGTGTARGALTVNMDTRAITAHVNLVGIDAPTAAHLHQAFAGASGPVSVGLSQDSADSAHFFVENATLSQAAFDALLAGGIYFNVHTNANPDGHVRGQIVPPNVEVVHADLTGLQQVPEVSSTARARAGITYNRDTRAIQIHLNSEGVDNTTGVHLHRGVAGTNGGIAIGLTQDGSSPTHWFVENSVLSPEDADALLAARTYVNLHTPANPDGELRAQVVPTGMAVLVNAMTGDQEVPVRTTSARGVAALTLDTTSGAAEVHVNATGVDDATAAHIHDGFAGVNGPVAVGLTQDSDPSRPGHWSVTGVTLTTEQIEKLTQGGLYANVHTPAAPGGLIRGQLLPSHVQLTFTNLSGDEEVPPVATTGSARAATTVDTRAMTVTAHVNTVDLDSATNAHIHVAPAGENGPVVIGLAQDANTSTRWSAIGASVTAEQLADYSANNWYVNVHTPANPNGEVRGQIVPNPAPAPDPDAEDPSVTLGSVPASISGTVTLTATATDNVGVATVRFLVNGNVVGSDSTAPYALDWDSTAVANGSVTISAEAQDAAGNVGTSAEAAATVSNGTSVVAFTFAELQEQVFTASCAASGCHSGSSAPFGLDLSAGQSYNNLVNVASGGVPSLMRVAPENADNSYLIRKLEGAAGIVGARMPMGGPYLSQATIDRIRAWINAGAPNAEEP